MRIFADENVPRRVVETLRTAGHDVAWGIDAGRGQSDLVRLADAFAAQRLVLTEDQDFADMVIRDGIPVVAIIRFRLAGMKREAKIDRIIEGVGSLGDDVVGKIVIIEPGRIRSRPIPPRST